MASPRLALLVLPAVAFAGCALGDDGPQTSQTRSVSSFSRIDSPSSADVRLHVGGPQRVVVRAGEKVIGNVHTDVSDGTLHVRFSHHGLGGNNVVIEATVPRLTEVDSTGSGDVDADGVAGGAVTVRSDGSGDVDLAGLEIDKLNVTIDGSGDVRYHGHPQLTQHVDGSGELKPR